MLVGGRIPSPIRVGLSRRVGAADLAWVSLCAHPFELLRVGRSVSESCRICELQGRIGEVAISWSSGLLVRIPSPCCIRRAIRLNVGQSAAKSDDEKVKKLGEKNVILSENLDIICRAELGTGKLLKLLASTGS